MTRITVDDIRARKGIQPIVMVTAYDYSMATWIDRAGVDMILVGDSLGMVMLGQQTTAGVTMAQMVHHAHAVCRGVARACVVGDLPKEALDADPERAVRCARQFIEVGCGAVKLEWRTRALELARALLAEQIPVMGHIGLTPQMVTNPADFRVQGRAADHARQLVDAAVALAAAGCFSIVLECIPVEVAARITEQLAIPTMGIGAGNVCDGQVLVSHDLLGLYPRVSPKFARKYVDLGPAIVNAVRAFCQDVRRRQFPAQEHTFHMQATALEQFRMQTEQTA